MRPLVRPDLPLLHQLSGQCTAASLLMSAFGHFCAFCERPLPDEAWVWNARTGRCLEDDSCDTRDWDYLYLLDRNCHAAQRRSSEFDASLLLLPTAEDAFNPLRPDSPLLYSMQSVRRVLVDDQGQELEHKEIDRVVVSGTTYKAWATIDYFALNTPYYEAEGSRLKIPLQDYLSLEDRRMDQRTRAWTNAEEVAWQVLNAQGFALDQVVTEQLRLLAGSMGFWSSSATATAHVLHDPDILRRIFFDAMEPPVNGLDIEGLTPDEAAVFRGGGPHNTFPGTLNIFSGLALPTP